MLSISYDTLAKICAVCCGVFGVLMFVAYLGLVRREKQKSDDVLGFVFLMLLSGPLTFIFLLLTLFWDIMRDYYN